MLDVLTGSVVQFIWPFVVAVLGALGVFFYGNRKKAEGHRKGREEELERSKKKVKEVETEMKAEVEKPRTTEETKNRLKEGKF